jgi:hypothetical protein
MKLITTTLISNVVSGLSLCLLIVFGFSYIKFINSPIYTSYKIEIINNPINDTKHIDFAMTGTKVLDCTANKVYGLATRDDGLQVKLDEFLRMYTHNVPTGETLRNTWTLRNPGLLPGAYRVAMISDWTCRHWIFTETTTRTHDSIYLLVE